MLGSFGWSSSQFSCLDPLWAHESGWSVTAYNAGSGAYGIPQALPGSRMASAGPDWQTNAATQIRWGLELHQGHLRFPVRRLGSRAGHRLVLITTSGQRGVNVSTISSKIGRIWFHMLCGAVMYSA